MTVKKEKRNRWTKFAVIGVLALFLLFAVLNAAVKTRVEAAVREEIREVSTPHRRRERSADRPISLSGKRVTTAEGSPNPARATAVLASAPP